MTHFTKDSLALTMPLTLKAHQAAQQFRQRQSDPQKAKQVYLNTLAVQAVSSYLGWFDIETDVAASDSWNPTIQSLGNIADLVIKGRGKLECRPVLPGEQNCQIPAEVWADRIGYVAVQFDSELSEATLLGFFPEAATREVPLTQLRSLEDLLDHLHPEVESIREPVKLGLWLQNVVEVGWLAVEELLNPPQLALTFRNATTTANQANQGKLLDVKTDSATDQVALLVGIMPINLSEMGVRVAVYPTGTQTQLPPDLEVMVLDETGVAVMQAQSRNTDMIQLEFNALQGEHFSVRVVLDTFSFTEAFVV